MTSDEVHAAFAHPEFRAEATAGPGPLDRIALRDHVRDVDIGAFHVERGHAQRLQFDVVVEVARQERVVDDVDAILSYDRLTEAIATEVSAERVYLLETLADRIAARILREPQAVRVFVRVAKLDRGPGALGVEIVRARDNEHTADAAKPPSCRVVYLGAPALNHPGLSDLLDRASADELPTILCVGAASGAAPMSRDAKAQRRIELLAIEQSAWVLASLDPRCVVVDSRTEIDWCLRQGRLAVWAPTRMVLDAEGGPRGESGSALAVWLAGLLGAVELRVVDANLPDAGSIPVVAESLEGSGR